MDTNNLTAETLSDGVQFIPQAVLDYMGSAPPVRGIIKRFPDDFIVEEQSTDKLKCSVATTSDLSDPYGDYGQGDFVAVTLVKCRHTTVGAISKMLNLIGLRPEDVEADYAGLLDRWAQTSQRVHIRPKRGRPPIDFETVLRSCMPDDFELSRQGSGIFIKDAKRVSKGLNIGQKVGNNFTIRVRVKGMSASELESYIEQRVRHLRRDCGNIVMPNGYGRQRLGFRQNLARVGYDFIVHGAEAGIKRFLTESTANEGDLARLTRSRLADDWQAAEEKAAAEGTSVAKQALYLQGMLRTLEETDRGTPLYEKLNMVIEWKIVSKLLEHLDYKPVLMDLYNDFSLWAGAYQGFFFNRILGRVLSGELRLPGQDQDTRIPLFMDERKSREFYQQYCPEALPPRMDPLIREAFLLPGGRTGWKLRMRGQRPKQHWMRKAPRRNLFVTVKEFSYSCSDGEANVKFGLRSGAYATTFLGILFDIDKKDDKR